MADTISAKNTVTGDRIDDAAGYLARFGKVSERAWDKGVARHEVCVNLHRPNLLGQTRVYGIGATPAQAYQDAVRQVCECSDLE
jgi:hypothetical protein